MCGIAGFLNSPLPPEGQRRFVEAMTKVLAHRGPDETGHWLDTSSTPAVALGHTRLSIIDLSDGQQPMFDPTGRLAITFNGEIYNFLEIREQLEAKGHSFSTRSDTEVILHAYLEKGADCLQDFEGMFALAIWDKQEQTLFAARDRAGKKPFYYTLKNGVFAFASELTALAQLPFLELRADREAMARFLAHKFVPTPQTIYQGVYKLKPGHFLRFKEGDISTRAFWDLPLPESRLQGMDEAQCADKIRELCATASTRRLISDVPLGAFLSGGIDSSAIVALMAKACSEPVKTFSIGFSEPSYDESPFARLVAEKYATDHYEETLSALSTGSLLPEIVARQDEPMADPSIVPTYLLSGITRKKVTVALSGDGGDELFAGYQHYLGFKFLQRLKKLGPVSSGTLALAKRILPASTGYVSPRHVADRLHGAVTAPTWLCVQKLLEAVAREKQLDLWQAPPQALNDRDAFYAETRALWDAFPAKNPLDRVFYLFFKQYMLDYILVKVDRCSMMHSLEVRAPLLDRDLVEFAFALPARLKLKGSTHKYIFKQAVADLFPDGIVNRKKRGFLIPVAAWLKDQLQPLMHELLGEDALKRQGLFQPKYVARMLIEHESGKADHREELWALLVLQLWLKSHSPAIA